jgi:hypothetical protein
MSNRKTIFITIALAVHLLAAIALVLLFLKTGGMTVFCVVAGALIGCASVAARPGRAVTMYVAFGMLMGYAFWMGASAISQRAFLELVVLLLLVGGVVWLLQDPRWPSALFSGVVVLLCLGLAVLQYTRREFSEYDPELVRRSVLTSYVVLGLGLVYLGLGLAETALQKAHKARRLVRRAKRRPTEPTE